MLFKFLNQFTLKPMVFRKITQSKILLQETKGSSSNLFKLRKSTGYALNKCKEALEKHEGNIEAAKEWLDQQAQKEGWTKAEKLKNRQTKQGTLVLYSDKEKKKATLIELNCETDFVARNEKFLDFSSNLAKSILLNTQSEISKELIEKEKLNKIKYLDQSKTLEDQIALAIGNLGENMSLRRAVIFNLRENEYLGWYMHGFSSDSMNNCHFGKYGALVNFSLTEKNENYKPFDIGRQIAQHIVGMKPLVTGDILTDEVNLEQQKIDENETRLLYQEFLMKPNTRVIDFLKENQTNIKDFVRFECGEILENDENI